MSNGNRIKSNVFYFVLSIAVTRTILSLIRGIYSFACVATETFNESNVANTNNWQKPTRTHWLTRTRRPTRHIPHINSLGESMLITTRYYYYYGVCHCLPVFRHFWFVSPARQLNYNFIECNSIEMIINSEIVLIGTVCVCASGGLDSKWIWSEMVVYFIALLNAFF